jgi:hypothetical protein
MATSTIILYGVLLPALITGAALFCALPLWRAHAAPPREPGPWRRAAIAFACVVAFASAYHHIARWMPHAWPVRSTEKLPWIALAAACACALPRAARWPAMAALAFGAAAWMRQPLLERALEREGGLAPWLEHVLAPGACVLAAWAALAFLQRGASSAFSAFALMLIASALAGASVHAGTALLGQLCGACAALLGAFWVAGLWRPNAQALAGALPFFALLLAALALDTWTYAEWKASSLIALASAPVCALVARRFAPAHPRLRLVLVLLALALPLGLAVHLARAEVVTEEW